MCVMVVGLILHVSVTVMMACSLVKTVQVNFMYACIKAHGSVSCGSRKQGVYVQRECINMKNTVQFTHVHSSVISCLNKIKFAVQVLAYQERTLTKLK